MSFLRLFLYPFAVLYGVVTWLRNKFFDWGIKKENEIPFASICVGNLSVGGTGKTPHVLLFNQWFSSENKIVILSRGYGRKTKGLIWADTKASAETIGDEPMQFLSALPKPEVVVSEKRILGIEAIQKANYTHPLVILDDAFQHRHVKAGFNVLLCDYHSPYFKDHLLPAGNLREFRSGEKRADVVIVTKCPVDLTEDKKQFFYKNIRLQKEHIFFSRIVYTPIEKWGEHDLPEHPDRILLVTGIANPKPLEQYLEKNFLLKSVIFPDHHAFTEKDIHDIHENFDNFAGEKTILLTTEKDAMRLEGFKKKGMLKDYPWFVQKITVEVDRGNDLKEKIEKYVRKV